MEDIDCACDLSKVGGLNALLGVLRSPHAALRAAAAEVLATVAQNNPKAQQQLLDGGVMERLLPLTREDADDTVRLKGLLALGCASRRASVSAAAAHPEACHARSAGLIRNFPAGEAAFKLGDGFGLLKASLAAQQAYRRVLYRYRSRGFQRPSQSAACSGELRVQRKALQLARALLTTDANLAACASYAGVASC